MSIVYVLSVGFLRIKHYGKHIIVVSRSLRIHLHLAHFKLNTIFVQQNNLIFIVIHNVVKRSSQLCGWILRTFQTRSSLLMLTLFKSIVLSRIDYDSQLWSPSKKGYICELERIQRSFT